MRFQFNITFNKSSLKFDTGRVYIYFKQTTTTTTKNEEIINFMRLSFKAAVVL